ncbi:MAG TPA: arsenite methyltransferase [Thermomicrobiales bacterium]|nr:arsenite methyltransferase [Thermomicrobiales bacterium]
MPGSPSSGCTPAPRRSAGCSCRASPVSGSRCVASAVASFLPTAWSGSPTPANQPYHFYPSTPTRRVHFCTRTYNLYGAAELAAGPEQAAAASLGCGNPTALADLRPGETVLDLGSGGGIDVLLSARRVGPTGTAYGLDMTDEMLALARANAAKANATNVEFLKGEIEAIPLPDNSVDVVISNCVINLSTDKGRVLREASRVLRPGGRFAVSDVVVDGLVPEDLRRSMELWVGCIAGALERGEYLALLGAAGFEQASIEPTRYYAPEDAGDGPLAAWLATQPPEERERLGRAFFSAFVRARKPAP